MKTIIAKVWGFLSGHSTWGGGSLAEVDPLKVALAERAERQREAEALGLDAPGEPVYIVAGRKRALAALATREVLVLERRTPAEWVAAVAPPRRRPTLTIQRRTGS